MLFLIVLDIDESIAIPCPRPSPPFIPGSLAAPPFTASPSSGEYFESPATLGRVVISRYALPFELVGIMLLAAAVAAVIIGRREASS